MSNVFIFKKSKKYILPVKTLVLLTFMQRIMDDVWYNPIKHMPCSKSSFCLEITLLNKETTTVWNIKLLIGATFTHWFIWIHLKVTFKLILFQLSAAGKGATRELGHTDPRWTLHCEHQGVSQLTSWGLIPSSYTKSPAVNKDYWETSRVPLKCIQPYLRESFSWDIWAKTDQQLPKAA